MFTKGDFHIHSTASDGCLSPREVVILAKALGIDLIAISDHNSIDGLTEAFEAGKEFGISVIPAVELSTKFNNESIHILGYFRSEKFNSAAFKQILKVAKAHKAYMIREVLREYINLPSSNKYLSTHDGIKLLKIFDAAVVLAHPIRISRKNLPVILGMPFDGIEAKYCRNNDYYTNLFINLALKNFSFYTAGSDFHTDEFVDNKHSHIGEPYLDSVEIRRFLENSGAIIKGNSINSKTICL